MKVGVDFSKVLKRFEKLLLFMVFVQLGFALEHFEDSPVLKLHGESN